MEEKIFKAVVDKFEHDVVDQFYTDGYEINVEKRNNKVIYYFEKNVQLSEANEIKDQIENKYWSDYEFNEFDDWWKFNGDDYKEQFLKKNPNDKDDMLTIAFEEWSEKHGYECWDGFNDFLNLKKFYEIEIINEYEDKIEFICTSYYEHDMQNGEFHKTIKSAFVYEFQLDKMCEILNNAFEWNFYCKDTLLNLYLPIYEAKINKIAKKIIS